MKKLPLVSIIIPCYNAEKYVAEAIESALNQTHKNIEVIVVDDASTDRSIEIIQSFGDRLKFDSIEHKGACAARNRGLQLCQGEYIQFLDADDVLLVNKIEVQIPILQSDKADLVFCNGYLFGDERPQRPIKKLLGLASPDDKDPFLYCLVNGFGTEGPLHRRTTLEKVGGFREGLVGGQEVDLHIRLGAIGTRLYKLDDFLFKHRNHNDPNRITRTPKEADFMLKSFIELCQIIEKDFPTSLTPERKEALAGKIFQSSIHAYRNGAELTAKKGFDIAKNIAPSFTYNERRFYKFLVRYLDPFLIENLLKKARLSRDTLKKFFGKI